MEVKELILLLSQMQPDSEIVISCEGDTVRDRAGIIVFEENGDTIVMIA